MKTKEQIIEKYKSGDGYKQGLPHRSVKSLDRKWKEQGPRLNLPGHEDHSEGATSFSGSGGRDTCCPEAAQEAKRTPCGVKLMYEGHVGESKVTWKEGSLV